jgi:transposase
MDTTDRVRRRNRSWPLALKREIVAASFAPGASVSKVARRYDVNANQVFKWRHLYQEGSELPAEGCATRLLPVMVTAEQPADVGLAETAAATIEIDVARRYRVRVGAVFDGDSLRRVLDVLERR